MATAASIAGDLVVQGNLAARTMTIPANTVTNAGVAAGAGIAATKLEHQFAVRHSTNAGTAVTAQTVPIHVVHGTTGEIVAIKAALLTVPSGGDTVTIDLHRSTGGAAFASVLSAAVVLDNTNTVRVAEAGTVTSPDTVAGDVLQLVITVSGTSSQGLVVTTTLREDAA